MIKRFSLALASLSMTASVASADPIDVPDIFRGVGDEGSNRYLNMIFGPLWDGTAENTIISVLIVNFNILFLALGLALLVYNMIVAVTQTAHDGKVFGKNSSSLWAPVRTILAAAMLIPLPTGYNGVQHAIAYVTNVGTGAASYFWAETAEAVVSQRVNVAGIDHQAHDVAFIGGLWRLEMCRAAYNHEIKKSGNGAGLEQVAAQWTTPTGDEPPVLQYSTPSTTSACGSVVMPARTRAFERLQDGAGGAAAYSQYISGLIATVDGLRNGIAQVVEPTIKSLSENEPVSGRNIDEATVGPWREAHRDILKNFISESVVEASIQREIREGEEFVFSPVENDNITIETSMIDDGWTQAGFYYQSIARMSADTASVSSAIPSISYGSLITTAANPEGRAASDLRRANSGLMNYLRGADTEELLSGITNTYALGIDWLNEQAAKSGLKNFSRNKALLGDHISDAEDMLPNAGQLFTLLQVIDPTQNETGDPLIGLIHLGQAVSVWIAAAIAGIVVLGAVPFAGGAASVLSSMVGWIISGLGVAAISMAFILPMIPTLMWVLALAAFIMLVIQAVFAGPLWAISHLSLEGEGLAGQSARRGYLMILSIFVTPTLMIFGLLASMVLFRILGTLFNGGIFLALSGAMSMSSHGFTSITLFMGMFVTLVFVVFGYIIIIERCFSMIAWLPNAVMNVLDAWVSGIGVTEADTAGARDGRLSAGAGMASSAIGSAGGTAPKLGSGIRGKQEQKIRERRALRQLQKS